MKKYLSRKFLVVVIGGILDVMIANGQLPAELKPLVMSLVTSLAGLYVVVEGIIDVIKKND